MPTIDKTLPLIEGSDFYVRSDKDSSIVIYALNGGEIRKYASDTSFGSWTELDLVPLDFNLLQQDILAIEGENFEDTDLMVLKKQDETRVIMMPDTDEVYSPTSLYRLYWAYDTKKLYMNIADTWTLIGTLNHDLLDNNGTLSHEQLETLILGIQETTNNMSGTMNAHISSLINPHKTEIKSLVDTNIIAPIEGQYLVYNSLTSKWENKVSIIGDGVIPGSALVSATTVPLQANLFNKDKVTSGIVDNGTLSSSVTYSISEPTRVIQGQYTISYAEQTVGSFFDANNNYLSEINISSVSSPYTFTVPIGAVYFRFNVKNTRLDTMMLCKGTTLPTEYTPYSERYSFSWLSTKEDNYEDASISAKKLQGGTRSSVNLFDKDSSTSGIVDNGAISSSTTYHISDFVLITQGEQYTISYAELVVGSFFDTNKSYLSEINIASVASPYTFIVPTGAAYFRFNIKDSRLSSMMMVEGTSLPEAYIQYTEKYVFPWLTTKEENYATNSIPYNALNTNAKQTILSKWNNKKWLIWGDSLTEHNFRTNKNYHDYIAEKINCTVYNHGVGGTGYFNRYDVSSLTENPDLITIWLGSNDFGNNTTDNQKSLGSFGDTTNATIAGCVYLTLQNMINKYPTVPICVFTPLQRRNNYGSNATPNSRGFTLKQTSDIIIANCNHFGIKVLDLYNTCSFNISNDSANAYYFTAPGLTTPDGLHLNDNGHKILADRGLDFINSL